VLDLAFESLTAALVSFLHVFDPEVLILGGNVAAAGPQLLARLQEEVERRTRVLLGRKVPIVLQSTVGYGGVAGAAGLVFVEQGLLTI
jgi:glucokinase